MLQPVIYFSETFLANFLIFSKLNKVKDKTLPYMSSAKYLKKESDIKQEGTKGDWSRSRENSRRRYSRSRSRSRDRSRNYDRNSSHERRDSQYRYKHSQSKERGERSQRNRSRSGERSSQSKERGERSRRSRSRSGERSSQSARKRNRSPAEKCDRYAKQSSIKDPSDKKKARSPDNLEVELLRKRRELMELNELIARKKAIVAMEHNAKKVEPEDGKSGVTTFDYEHVHRENIWMPDLKPGKSILKKQSEPHSDSQFQVCFYMGSWVLFHILFSHIYITISYLLQGISQHGNCCSFCKEWKSRDANRIPPTDFCLKYTWLLNIWKYCREDFDHCRVWKGISNSD